MKPSLKCKLQPLSLATALLMGGCASQVQRLEPQLGTPRMAIDAPAPEANALLACFGKRLERHMDLAPGGLPPVVVEVLSYKNANTSPIQRQEIQADGAIMVKSLLTAVSPLLAVLNSEGSSGTGSARALLRLQGEIQIVESMPVTAARGWDASWFGRDSDVAGRNANMTGLAAITVDATLVGPDGLSKHGAGVPVRVTFERSFTHDRSLSASFSSVALGFTDSKKIVNGYGPAVRLAVATQLVVLLSRATNVPATACVAPLASDAFDALPLHGALKQFRMVEAQDERAASYWLWKLMVLHGRAAAPGLDAEALTAVLEQAKDSAELRRFVAEQERLGKTISERAQGFIQLWATLGDVPASSFEAGSALIDRLEAQLAAERAAAARTAEEAKAGARTKALSPGKRNSASVQVHNEPTAAIPAARR